MFVEYPRHPQQSRWQPCGEMLLKYVKSVSGKCRLKPRKIFCTYDLISSISKILNDNGIINLLQEWKSRVNSAICLSVVYDVSGKSFNNNVPTILILFVKLLTLHSSQCRLV